MIRIIAALLLRRVMALSPAIIASLGFMLLLALAGCEDRAYPLDCPNACGHRLD